MLGRELVKRQPPGHVALAAILLALASGWASPVFAAAPEPAKLGLTPVGQPGPYFELEMSPGDTRRLEVEVANLGRQSILARTYAAEAYSLVNGGFGAALFGAPPSGTVRWLDYATSELDLAPGRRVVVGFDVRVPDSTPPGEYVAALVAENVEPEQAGGGTVTINQVNRVAIAVAIEIPGPRHPALKIADVSYKLAGDTSFVTFGVANPGNVHVKPVGEFVLRDSGRAELARTMVTMDSVYATMGTRLEVPLVKPLAPGDYCAELRLTDPVTTATDATSCLPFRVIPPPQTVSGESDGSQAGRLVQGAIDAGTAQPVIPLVGVAVLFVVGALFLLVRRRRRRGQAPL